MSTPDTRVYIAFDLAAGGVGDFFTLNDAEKGRLGGGTVTGAFDLAGDILVDVTEDVRAINVRRGRSRQLEAFQAGAATVDLNNDKRKYDPAAGTAITPYGASMRPRKQVVIESNGQRVFSGVVDDWDLDYSLAGDHIASVSSTDGFVFLASQFIDRHTSTSQTTGERIDAILDRAEINYQGATDIDTGRATLQADVVSDSSPANLLSYLQAVENAEPGALFMDKAGVLTFRERTDLQQATSVVFADDGSGIPFSAIQMAYGAEELRNRVSVSILNGGTATASSQDSIDIYGTIDFDVSNSLLADTDQAEELAVWLANTYSEPQLRVDRLEVNLSPITSDQANSVLALELGDVIEVVFTPSGIGNQIQAFASIDSIEHRVEALDHVVVLDLSQTIAAFELDSAVFGVLDSNKLGF